MGVSVDPELKKFDAIPLQGNKLPRHGGARKGGFRARNERGGFQKQKHSQHSVNGSAF